MVIGWESYCFFSDEDQLFLREEAADTFSLEELLVTVSAAAGQAIDGQAIGLLIVWLNEFL